MKDLELFMELFSYTVLVASPFVAMVYFGMASLSYQEIEMTYKECAGVLFESLIVGFCLAVPMVWLLDIILNTSK